MNIVKYCAAISFFLVLIAGGYIYSGLYPMGADVPHNKLSYFLLETLREKSIEAGSKDIKVPPLNNSELLLSGGADYNDMCSSCHLQPGKMQSDMSLGLYPMPPNLSLSEDNYKESIQSARRQFWVIKHGIKASGMPAWGVTHDDQRIWAMVAFLQKLPNLTPEQYQIITARDETNVSSDH